MPILFILVCNMGKPCQKGRAKWTTAELQQAITSVRYGRSVSDAARSFDIPRRTLRDWLDRSEKNQPITKLRRNLVLSSKIERQLRYRIFKLQQFGFGTTKRLLCETAVEISNALNIKTPFSNGKARIYWFEGFRKRNPGTVLRKGENLSYGRLMCFNKETVRHFFEHWNSIFEETEFQPHQIYNVDETGLQLIFSGKDKVLAEKGSKRVHVGEQGETITVIACSNASGNWIPPMML